MLEKEREAAANQRFSLIAPIIKYPTEVMSRGHRYELLRQISTGQYPGLESLAPISIRTLERYLMLYRKGGTEALKPVKKEGSHRISLEWLKMAAELRQENRSRSIDMIISMLELSGRVPKGVLKSSTVYDYFTKHKLTRTALGTKSGQYTRYGAAYRAEILQGDVHYTLKLPDPIRPGQERQVYLFAWIDDYSRLVHGQFYWKESRPALEDSLKRWILLYGLPYSIFCDNGAVYSSHYMANICSALGIQLHHSRPYRPQGKGKCEKLFQLVESSFKYEAELLIKQNKQMTLEKLNDLFSIWLSRFYNQRKHSATKQSPVSRWEGCEHPVRKVSLETIQQAFLWRDTRSVTKTGIISIDSNEYEVEPFLCGKKVDVLYDPYNLSTGIRIFQDGQQYKDAIPAKVHRHSKKGFNQEHLEVAPSSGLNFLEQLAQEELSVKRSMNFSALGGTEP